MSPLTGNPLELQAQVGPGLTVRHAFGHLGGTGSLFWAPQPIPSASPLSTPQVPRSPSPQQQALTHPQMNQGVGHMPRGGRRWPDRGDALPLRAAAALRAPRAQSQTLLEEVIVL